MPAFSRAELLVLYVLVGMAELTAVGKQRTVLVAGDPDLGVGGGVLCGHQPA